MGDRGRVRRVIGRALALRCPRCGAAPLFAGGYRMRRRCPSCGLLFEREAGYWIGAIYVNYALTVGTAVGGYLLLDALWAPSAGWQVAIWGAFVVIFPLGAFRWAKALWLGLDHLVDPGDGEADGE